MLFINWNELGGLKMIRKKSISLTKRLLSLVLIGTAFQSLVIVFMLHGTGVFKDIQMNSFLMFKRNAGAKNDVIDTALRDISISSRVATTSLNENLINIAALNGISASELAKHDDLLHTVMETALKTSEDILLSSDITSAFFTIRSDDDWSSNYHNGFFLSNESPDNKRNYELNIILQRGPREFLVNHDFRLGESWKPDINIPNFTMATMLLEMNKTRGIAEYSSGFWSRQRNSISESMFSFMYIVPMFDENNEMYAFFGIEIDDEFLKSAIMPKENFIHASSFYVVGHIEEDILYTDWIVTETASKGLIIQNDSGFIDLNQSVFELFGVSEVNLPLVPGINYIAIKNIFEAYVLDHDLNTIRWGTVALSPTEAILQTARYTENTIHFVTFISAIVCVIVLGVSVLRTTRNIMTLRVQMAQVSTSHPIVFEKTNFTEIDGLTAAIETLHKNIIDSSTRIVKILELMEEPIGCFQNDDDKDHVFVTTSLLKIFNVGETSEEYILMPKDKWNNFFGQIIRNPYNNMKNTYTWKIDDKTTKWVRVEVVFSGSSCIGVIVDATTSVIKQQQLEFDVNYDTITKLLKRNSFKSRAYESIKSAPNKIGCMIFADLDNLKFVNDHFGHEAGDQYIIKAAEMLGSFRKLGGIVARMSGDEFAVYIHGFEDKEIAQKQIMTFASEHMKAKIKTQNGKELRLSCSLGICWYPHDAKTISTLIKFADFAMYASKSSGKGKLSKFNIDDYMKANPMKLRKESLEKVMDERLIEHTFSPIYHIPSGKLYGYDTEIRLLSDEFQTHSEFVRAAHSNSRQEELEDLEFDIAIDCITANLASIGNKMILLNSAPAISTLSSENSTLMEKYIKFMNQIIFAFGSSGNSEQEDLFKIEYKIDSLNRSFNANIAIGDFGSSTNNMNKIAEFSPKIVKINMTYLHQIDNDEEKKLMVKNYISYCKNLNILILIESVGSEQDYISAIQFGADLVNGDFIGEAQSEIENLDITKLFTISKMLDSGEYSQEHIRDSKKMEISLGLLEE